MSTEDILMLYQAPIKYYDPNLGEEEGLDFDYNFNNSLGPLSEDYLERAIPIEAAESARIHIYVANPIDVAISKLGRYSEQDAEDIKCLLTRHKVNLQHFEKIARDAISYYVGDKNSVLINLRQSLEEMRAPDNEYGM